MRLVRDYIDHGKTGGPHQRRRCSRHECRHSLRGPLCIGPWLPADTKLARNPRLLLQAAVCQASIFWLDATTLGVLVLAMGEPILPSAAFACYMFASVFRSIGILPGGLGTFEATAVLTLTMAGTSIPAALSATLIFRGLSFWLPMLPGLWFSRSASLPRLRAPDRRSERS